MDEISGWLLDLYPDPRDGCILWLLDRTGKRRRLTQDFPITFYAAGSAEDLHALETWLLSQPIHSNPSYTRQRDLFQPEDIPLLAIETSTPNDQANLFSKVAQIFPELTYYNADLPLYLHHSARYSTFPLAYCHIQLTRNEHVEKLIVQDTPWDTEPEMPPLRILSLKPDVDPYHKRPTSLIIQFEQQSFRLRLSSTRLLLFNLSAILRNFDPDLLLTSWGDSWLIRWLTEQADKLEYPLPLNRDAQHPIEIRKERSYFSYGQVIYRDKQFHLFGRIHIDTQNAMLYHDYGLDGVFELSRVTSLPLQLAARLSPGTGISTMQMVTALRQNILVPWHKQQVENIKTASQLLLSDQGGLVYQPTIGLHQNVAECDFISMYPSIMVHCNISPETQPMVRVDKNLPFENEQPPGLIPQTLSPLLEKRLALKRLLMNLPNWNPKRKRYKAQTSAHKWLLVTCFGYLGYRNARFGRIEAHEAVTAYGREALLRAKEVAENSGFSVLHLYVDGLWIYKEGANTPQNIQPVLEEISSRTGLPIALEGIYRWVAFLPSRQNSHIPVANRYFGIFQDGTLKARGIEARRRDTPLWIAEAQMDCLESMGKYETSEQVIQDLPAILDNLRHQLHKLHTGNVPIEKLIISQKVSRIPSAYTVPSPAARAALQLEANGKSVRPGQIVRFIHVLGTPDVYAWDIPVKIDIKQIDLNHYMLLFLRAATTILQPFGVAETKIKQYLLGRSDSNQPLLNSQSKYKQGTFRLNFSLPLETLYLNQSVRDE